jgi:hypothetical protein
LVAAWAETGKASARAAAKPSFAKVAMIVNPSARKIAAAIAPRRDGMLRRE